MDIVTVKNNNLAPINKLIHKNNNQSKSKSNIEFINVSNSISYGGYLYLNSPTQTCMVNTSNVATPLKSEFPVWWYTVECMRTRRRRGSFVEIESREGAGLYAGCVKATVIS